MTEPSEAAGPRIVGGVHTAAVVTLAAAVVAVAAVGCSGDADTPGSTTLTVVYQGSQDGGEAATWTLRCDPPGGSHPDPTAACSAVESQGSSAFEPTPAGTACAEIFGGPQRAEVSGEVGGVEVDSVFDRRNGCEIDRWDALAGLLPAPS